MCRLALLLASLVLLATGCGGDGGTVNDDRAGRSDRSSGVDGSARGRDAPPGVGLREVGSFDAPVHVVALPGTDAMAVVEKGGRVLVLEGGALQCAWSRDGCARLASDPAEPHVALDLTDEVSTGSEQGLLGLAFHPSWPRDPRLWVNYTDRDGDTRIVEHRMASPRALATGVRELLHVAQPYPNHNGGHLAFGPDGLLYAGLGDGGSGGDPEDRAQDRETRLGKLLRIDVDAAAGDEVETWALGLRNPWRFSFDRTTGDLWIGDVGQDEWEEVDALTAAQLEPGAERPNFQWRRREGFESFDDSGREGPGTSTGPVLAYGRDHGCSITGGVVYRGRAIPELDGWYLFGDFCAEDELRMVDGEALPGSQPKQPVTGGWWSTAGTSQVASFAETGDGEVLVVSLAGGVFALVADDDNRAQQVAS